MLCCLIKKKTIDIGYLDILQGKYFTLAYSTLNREDYSMLVIFIIILSGFRPKCHFI